MGNPWSFGWTTGDVWILEDEDGLCRHPFSLILSSFLRVPANPLWQCTKAHQADYRL
jgi:hypothetical protein